MSNLNVYALFVTFFLLAGCAVEPPYVAPPTAITAPTPIQGNSGEFMSPYTTDGVMAEWVDKSVNAKAGAAIGGAVGAYAGQKLAEQIPFFGGMLGQEIGESTGRAVALEMAGGEEFIKSSSDISFNNLYEMSVWMYVTHSSHAHYQDALDATFAIYPEMQQIYHAALVQASASSAPMSN